MESVKTYLEGKFESGIDNVASMIHESKDELKISAKYQKEKMQNLADNIQELSTLQKESLADNSVNSSRILELVNVQDKYIATSSVNTASILDLKNSQRKIRS